MLVGLYRVNLEGIAPTIETVDFVKLLDKVEENSDKISKIEGLVNEVVQKFGFEDEFELYIGAGLGHVNGCSLPGEIPMVYIGIECVGYTEIELEYLIPHEMNHMIRLCKVNNINANTFKERVVSEGLGTIYPLILNEQSINAESLAKVLLMPVDQVKTLLENEKELIEIVFEKIDFELTPQLMKQFFVYDANAEDLQLVGYFVGILIIQKLLESGYDIISLTQMPAKEIIDKYQGVLE